MKKLNKKGFTLVELIAVIAILSILMILALPQVLNLFQEGKESAFMTQAQSIYKTSEDNFIAHQIKPTGSDTVTFCYDGQTNDDNASVVQLDLSGSDEVYYKVVFVNGGMTKIQVKDKSFAYESTGDKPKINDINQDNLKNNPDEVTIDCSTTN